MAEQEFRFNDGAAYERMMGTWSRIVGELFIDWLAPRPGLRWIDIGCGNGAFTQMIADRCAPIVLAGVDPSAEQLAYARTRPGLQQAELKQGHAMALPFADQAFDMAVMALAIFFVPEPAKGVAEMVRVVKQGGTVALYAWDMPGGGFPLAPIQDEVRKFGSDPTMPPTSWASAMPALQQLWHDAGLEAIETREFTVQRRFTDFEDFWSTSVSGSVMGAVMAPFGEEKIAEIKEAVRSRMAPGGGPVTGMARANAIKGVRPH